MMRLHRALGGKPVSTWTKHDNKSVRIMFQNSYDDLIKWREASQAMGKGTFLKFHCLELVEPVSETKWLHGASAAKGMQPWTVATADDVRGSGSSSSARSEGNETCLPDAILKSWKPTFLIRHPALVMSSLVRADFDSGSSAFFKPEAGEKAKGIKAAWEALKRWEMSFHWQRQLLEWYLEHLTDGERRTLLYDVSYPVVLDADDIQGPGAPELLRKYTRAVGLDPDVVSFQWNVAQKEELEELNIYEQRLLDTINASTGIVPGKTAKGLVLEKEKDKWRKDFGEEVGSMLSRWVEEAMLDYERMHGLRLMV